MYTLWYIIQPGATLSIIHWYILISVHESVVTLHCLHFILHFKLLLSQGNSKLQCVWKTAILTFCTQNFSYYILFILHTSLLSKRNGTNCCFWLQTHFSCYHYYLLTTKSGGGGLVKNNTFFFQTKVTDIVSLKMKKLSRSYLFYFTIVLSHWDFSYGNNTQSQIFNNFCTVNHLHNAIL